MNSTKKLLFFIIILYSGICHAKQQRQSNWDAVLDRYELICERCLELKRGQDSGITLENESISSLRVQLTMLRNNLLEVQGQMSKAQKARFDMIRQRFESRFTSMPNIREKRASSQSQTAPPQEIKKKKADLDMQPDSTSKIIHTNISPLEKINTITITPKAVISLPPVQLVTYNHCPHYLPPKHEVSYMVGLQGTIYPLKSFGMMIGAMTKTKRTNRIGGYVKCLSDFRFKGIMPSYLCDSNGIMPDGRKIWTYGETTSRRFSAAAGALMSVGKHCGLNLGIGYGSTRHYIKDISDNWAELTDRSASGFSIEMGGLFFIGNYLWANIGLSTTAFRYFEPQLAFGFRF